MMMDLERAATVLKILDTTQKYLLAWVAPLICLLLVVSCTASPTTAPAANREELATYQSGTSSLPADRVEAVYFHRAHRCTGCIYAETGIRYTLETYFKDELTSGKLTFEVFNVEDKNNATIVEKYGAFASSLFINTITDGTDHIEEVTDIWFVLGNDEAFVEVVKSKIEESLKGVS